MASEEDDEDDSDEEGDEESDEEGDEGSREVAAWMMVLHAKLPSFILT